MAEAAELSLDAVLERVVRAAVRDVVRAELADLRADVAALKRAAPPALVDIAAFCEHAGVSQATARRMAARGDVQVVRRGRILRFDLGSLRPAEPETIAKLAREARGAR